MFVAKEKWIGKVDFDLGSEIGTRPLSNAMPQEHLKRIFETVNGSEYVEVVVVESKKAKGKEVSDVQDN